ncbi:MAG: hypothetical protein JKY54_12175 [Flavobacteriales bacterium]|nr:hypothetical protein [Flavobacteriales bacterium]
MNAKLLYHISNTLSFLVLAGYGLYMLYPGALESVQIKPMYLIGALLLINIGLRYLAKRSAESVGNPLLTKMLARVFYYSGLGVFALAVTFMYIQLPGKLILIGAAILIEFVALVLSFVLREPVIVKNQEILDDIDYE